MNFIANITKIIRIANNHLRVTGSCSDIRPDMFRTRMSLELYHNFIRHWKERGDTIDLNVAHYKSGTCGYIEKLWVDGKYLKFQGIVIDNPIGLEVQPVLLDEKKRNKVGFSIGFDPIDSYIDERHFNIQVFTDGILDHTAFTTIPANPRSKNLEVIMRARTQYDDAKEFVGARLAEWLESQEKELRIMDEIIRANGLTPEYLHHMYEHLKDKVSSEDWQEAMKHARGHAGGKVKANKKKQEEQKYTEDVIPVAIKVLAGTPIAKMANEELLSVHDILHEEGVLNPFLV